MTRTNSVGGRLENNSSGTSSPVGRWQGGAGRLGGGKSASACSSPGPGAAYSRGLFEDIQALVDGGRDDDDDDCGRRHLPPEQQVRPEKQSPQRQQQGSVNGYHRAGVGEGGGGLLQAVRNYNNTDNANNISKDSGHAKEIQSPSSSSRIGQQQKYNFLQQQQLLESYDYKEKQKLLVEGSVVNSGLITNRGALSEKQPSSASVMANSNSNGIKHGSSNSTRHVVNLSIEKRKRIELTSLEALPAVECSNSSPVMEPLVLDVGKVVATASGSNSSGSSSGVSSSSNNSSKQLFTESPRKGGQNSYQEYFDNLISLIDEAARELSV
jgi:hypothetical protein